MTSGQYPHVRVEGEPQERGRQYGEQARERMLRSRDAYEEVFDHLASWSWDKVTGEAMRYVSSIRAFRPEYLEEMRGMAEGSGLRFEDILALNVRSEVMFAAKARQALSRPAAGAGECTAFASLPERTRRSRAPRSELGLAPAQLRHGRRAGSPADRQARLRHGGRGGPSGEAGHELRRHRARDQCHRHRSRPWRAGNPVPRAPALRPRCRDGQRRACRPSGRVQVLVGQLPAGVRRRRRARRRGGAGRLQPSQSDCARGRTAPAHEPPAARRNPG